MQVQQYLTDLRLKVSFILQTRLARLMVAGIVLTLSIALALYLAGHAPVTTTHLSHTTTSAVQQLAEGPVDGPSFPPTPTPTP